MSSGIFEHRTGRNETRPSQRSYKETKGLEDEKSPTHFLRPRGSGLILEDTGKTTGRGEDKVLND